MQSTEHFTGCRTKLYAPRACCTVYNTNAERVCSSSAEWVAFKADLWNSDSHSRANFFRFGHCVNIGVQQDSFLVPVPSGVATFARQKHSKVSPSSARWLYTLVMGGGEKSIGKALQLVGFLSYLDSRTNQTQAVILEKKWTAIRFPSWYGTRRSQTD